jgi:hypothetical protein
MLKKNSKKLSTKWQYDLDVKVTTNKSYQKKLRYVYEHTYLQILTHLNFFQTL